MVGFMEGKMKRKDLEEVFDEFSEFSLSSPARKIRRLDAELPPIIEGEDLAVPLDIEQQPQLTKEEASVPAMVIGSGPAVEDGPPTLPTLPSNEERALVLYKPVEGQLLFGPGGSNVSFRVSSDFLHGLKSQVFHRRGNHMLDEEPGEGSNNCLAVVPWVGREAATNWIHGTELRREVAVEEPMEAEEAESASMEVEGGEREQNPDNRMSEGSGDGGFNSQWQQQQQQHCMNPQFGPNPTAAATPVMWSW
ncbi:uncharacterized protein LOC109726020 [Ananas comosus]|uniref:Uncharacterized protein LOC109726020 n=1 Tax=Ananas comosus TaxID=4615 RepID=A0A199V399_ANACO|nr:uncharacterized protein LOC109726020 [Ananas comosus]OAY71371.1 hypothetical protein ACMD2_16891 [Ananas comosus]